ncbi:MAG: DUF4386 domain-containing protein [Demequina sp.]|jgi:hypothetical protein|nr:DUF4386 domain-containing protein [Demequina sp.]
MSTLRKQSILVGALFLVTHVTSVGAVALYGPMLTDDSWLQGSDAGTRQLVGVTLDIVLALAVIGTGLGFLAILRERAPIAGAPYAILRTAEAGVILAGAAAVTALVWTRAGGAGSEPLLELYRATFLIGPGLIVVANTLVLATTLFRLRLVPRWIPVLGMIGAPLVGISNLAVLFGAQEQVSATASAAAVPIFAWEISLAVYLLVKGVREA